MTLALKPVVYVPCAVQPYCLDHCAVGARRGGGAGVYGGRHPGCPADGACTITRDLEVTGVCTLDFGTRSLAVGRARTIRVAPGGTLTVTAGSLTLHPGAFIDGRGRDGDEVGASITVWTGGAVVLPPRARIDVSDDRDAGVTNITADGDVHLGGPLTANAGAPKLDDEFPSYSSGFIQILAGGDLVSTPGAVIAARGGYEGARCL